MIVDAHVHVFPDSLAPKAVAALEAQGGVRAVCDGTVGGLLRSMDRAGIDRSIVHPVSTRAEQVESANRWVTGLARDRIVPFGTLFPGMTDPRGEAARLIERGVPGIKLHADYQGVDADDPLMFPLYEACLEYGLIVLMHAGIDIGLYPPVRATPRMIAAVLDRYPGLRVVAAHLGGHQMWDDVERFLLGRNLFFDTAYSIGDMTEEFFLSLLRRHGAGRVLFATDHPWLEQARAVGIIRDWALTGAERRMVFGGNAERLLDGCI